MIEAPDPKSLYIAMIAAGFSRDDLLPEVQFEGDAARYYFRRHTVDGELLGRTTSTFGNPIILQAEIDSLRAHIEQAGS